jgi:hypothetical protein
MADFHYIEVDSRLNGPDFGQIIFDTYTSQLPAFDVEHTQIFTGIGYVFTQARDSLPFVEVRGTYHPEYNPHPEKSSAIRKLYLSSYDFDIHFPQKRFVKYPECKNIIICDWNQESCKQIQAIIHAAPDAFRGKRIFLVHCNIRDPASIDVIRRTVEEYGLPPIDTIYFTNIFNRFTPEDIALYQGLSDSNINLLCDPLGEPDKPQLSVMTKGEPQLSVMTEGGHRKRRRRTKRRIYRRKPKAAQITRQYRLKRR